MFDNQLHFRTVFNQEGPPMASTTVLKNLDLQTSIHGNMQRSQAFHPTQMTDIRNFQANLSRIFKQIPAINQLLSHPETIPHYLVSTPFHRLHPMPQRTKNQRHPSHRFGFVCRWSGISSVETAGLQITQNKVLYIPNHFTTMDGERSQAILAIESAQLNLFLPI